MGYMSCRYCFPPFALASMLSLLNKTVLCLSIACMPTFSKRGRADENLAVLRQHSPESAASGKIVSCWHPCQATHRLVGTTTISSLFWMGFIRCDCPASKAFPVCLPLFHRECCTS